jgi:hypothetical protein
LNEKHWLILIALALAVMLSGSVMVVIGEPGAGGLLLGLSCVLTVFGVMPMAPGKD